MSRRRFFGEPVDRAFFSKGQKSPQMRVVVWNKNRTTITDVVLDRAESPEYDITQYVVDIEYTENIVFENSEDSVATNCVLTLDYNRNGLPIEITERTMLDDTPIRIFLGDSRLEKKDWVPIFTGVIRGNPEVAEFVRGPTQRTMRIAAVDRAEAFLNTTVTAFSYAKGDDIGKAVVETAIQFMNLERREINVGFQDYPIGHAQSQLVDIEVMKGIAEMLFTTGKKPKFDSDGFLVAADTDLDKPPARVHENQDLVVSITRQAVGTAVKNSVRLLGVDDLLTEVVERDKRLAHGNITSGFFEKAVRDDISFSENKDKSEGARRAKETHLKEKISSLGELFGESISWQPRFEDDGYTVFGGQLVFTTGHEPEIRTAAIAGYLIETIIGWAFMEAGNPIAGSPILLGADIGLVAILLALTETGRVDWEIHGKPFQNVYQQIVATEQLSGLLTSQIREQEFRNDWFYDIPIMQVRGRELLKRELIRGWDYRIVLIDDPLLEVDDVIQIEDRKYYVTSIRRRFSRQSAGDGTIELTAWRFA